MGFINSYSDLLIRATGGNSGNPELLTCFKDKRIANGASASGIARGLMSLWRQSSCCGEGSVPNSGTAQTPDNTTDGSVKQTNAPTGMQKWLTSFGASSIWWTNSLSSGTLILYDRLLHNAGMSGTNTGSQTVGGTITRNTGGIGNAIWAEIYTTIGTTPATLSVSYTNQAGTSGRTATATVGVSGVSNLAQIIVRVPLQAGDYGVQAVANATLSGSTGTAGSFGITVARPLAYLPISFGSTYAHRTYTAGVPNGVKIDNGACLAFAWDNGIGFNQTSFWYDLATVCA